MSSNIVLFFALLLSYGDARSNWRRDIFDNGVDDPNGVISHLRSSGGNLYGEPSSQTGHKVSQWHEGMDVNPEELGEYAEGDILFPGDPGHPMARNGLKDSSTRWPGGVIPYVISPAFDSAQKRLILEAMNDYHRQTCIRFKPYTGEESDYVRITAGQTGCWSSVGKVGGVQDVNLQIPGCVTKKGTVIHELMHAVGFLHEQSRYERDEYIDVQWHNIMPGRRGNFDKASRETTDAFGVGYDYGSVMHYSSNAFSYNGQATIIPKAQQYYNFFGYPIFQESTASKIGQREGFSKKDIQKIRKMYKCSKQRRSNNNNWWFF